MAMAAELIRHEPQIIDDNMMGEPSYYVTCECGWREPAHSFERLNDRSEAEAKLKAHIKKTIQKRNTQ